MSLCSREPIVKLTFETLEPRELLAADLLKDVNAFSSVSSNPWQFTNAGGLVFFVADSEL